jgi:glycosyltransferase involved in cell wall biosynthesis
MKEASQPLDDLTIGVTFYNKKSYINALREQIENLTKLGARVLLVHDGSSEVTHEELLTLLRQEQNQRFSCHYQPNQGSAVARNLVISLTKTEYLAFLDADDYLDQQNLIYCLRNIKEFGADLLNTGYMNPSHEIMGPPIKEVQKPTLTRIEETNNIFENLGYWRYIYKTEFLIRNQMRFLPSFQQVGEYFILDDVFWMIQLQECFGSLLLIPRTASYYLWNTHTFTPDTRAKYRNQERKMLKATRVYLKIMRESRRKLSNREIRNLFQNTVSNLDNQTPKHQLLSTPEFIWTTFILKYQMENDEKGLLLRNLLVQVLKYLKSYYCSVLVNIRIRS